MRPADVRRIARNRSTIPLVEVARDQDLAVGQDRHRLAVVVRVGDVDRDAAVSAAEGPVELAGRREPRDRHVRGGRELVRADDDDARALVPDRVGVGALPFEGRRGAVPSR